MTYSVDPLIIDSDLSDSSVVYRGARVKGSMLHDGASVGDFSLVDHSILYRKSRINRNNHIYKSAIGKYTYTGGNTIIMCAELSSFCSVAWNVSIGSAEHDYSRISQHAFLYNDDGLRPCSETEPYDRFSGNVNIGSDVWIAAGAIIKRGLSIGHGALVAANSVVTHDVPPYAIVAGVPATIINYRFSDSIIEKLLQVQWWNWSDEEITQNYHTLSGAPDEKELDALLDRLNGQ